MSVEARWYALSGQRKAKRFLLDRPGDLKAQRRAEVAAGVFLDTVNTDKRRGSEVDPNAKARFTMSRMHGSR